LELGLSLVLGLDATLVTGIDMDRPIDAVMLSEGMATPVVLVFTPSAGSSFRSTLATRYRFNRVESLGEMLEPRELSARTENAWHCAIVGVGGESGARLVCSRSESALRTAGRWAAENARAQEQDSSDAIASITGDSFRELLLPTIERSVQQIVAGMTESARAERARHNTPPPLGDPEALLHQVDQLAQNVRLIGPDLTRIQLQSAVGTQELSIDTSVEYPANSQSVIALDARARTHVASTHALLGRLNPASWFASGANGAEGYFQRIAANVLTVTLAVLGSRVSRSEEMQRDWTELFAHLGPSVAAGCASASSPSATARDGRNRVPVAEPTEPRSPLANLECTAVLSQTDEGVAARAVIARLARAPWLRELRFGAIAPVISLANGALVLRLPPAPAARGGANQSTASAAQAALPKELAITVNHGHLAILLGPNTRAQLRALDAQIAGPGPRVTSGLSAPIVVGLDARLGRSPEQVVPLTVTVESEERDQTLRSTLHVRVPSTAFARRESQGL
jgi:hypothetical protein